MRTRSQASRPLTRLAYHASRTPLALGTVLEPRAQNLLDGDIEVALEASRPETRLARHAAVYAAFDVRHLENLTAGCDHIYRVEVRDGIVLDHAYANRIWHLYAEHENRMTDAVHATVARLARGYWSGRRAPFYGRSALMCPYAPEILCREARVVAEVDALAAA